MTDAELLKDFTAAQRCANGIAIRVARIKWPSPGEPKTDWLSATVLPANTRKADIDKARRKLLKDKTYFAVCTECQERNPIGWMHDEEICQSCAERKHGVVY